MPTLERRPFSFPAYRAFTRIELLSRFRGQLLADLGEIAAPPWVAEGFRNADPDRDVRIIGMFEMASKSGEPWPALVLNLRRRAMVRESGRGAPEREVLVAAWYDAAGKLHAKRINALPGTRVGA